MGDEKFAPAIILVGPQMGENIGAAARAMWNFGLSDLRLVNPRDGWPNPKATAMASGADLVVERAQVYARLEDAIADLNHLFAATARRRDMAKPTVDVAQAADEIRRYAHQGARCGVILGRENTGLDNDEVALASAVLTFKTSPNFPSLNLAQAALLVSYAWFVSDSGEQVSAPANESIPASRHELVGLFSHLESALDQAGFFRPPEKRPSMVRNLRNTLHKAGLSEQDIRSLRGVVAALSRKNR